MRLWVTVQEQNWRTIAADKHIKLCHRKAGYQEEILQATDNRGVDVILEMLANVNLLMTQNSWPIMGA